jgi:hypothetical protein
MIQRGVLPILFLAWYVELTHAQDAPVTIDPNSRALAGIGNAISVGSPGFTKRTEDVRGTPYLFEKWLPGKVLLKDGRILSRDAAFNVDASAGGGIVVLLPNGDAVDVLEVLVEEMEIVSETQNHVFRPFKSFYITGKEMSTWLMEVLYEDSTSVFLKRHSKYIRNADYGGAYSAERRYHEYIDEVEYYLGLAGKYSKIRLKKNSIQSVSPELADSINGPVSEESLVEALKKMHE